MSKYVRPSRTANDDARQQASVLKSQLDQIHDELDFEEHIETALQRAAALPAAPRHTDEEREKMLSKVATVFIQNLPTIEPPGVPLDRKKSRKSAKYAAPPPGDYVLPDTPRTVRRKEMDRLYPPLVYKPEKAKSLMPLSPRSRAKFDHLAKDIYNAKPGPNGETMSKDLRTKVHNLKASTDREFKDLANDIYHADTDGMMHRAVRNLRQTEGTRDEKNFREKAYELYKTDPGRQTFIDGTQAINEDPYFQKMTQDVSPQHKSGRGGDLYSYRHTKMKTPAHVGNFKILTRNEMKERGMEPDNYRHPEVSEKGSFDSDAPVEDEAASNDGASTLGGASSGQPAPDDPEQPQAKATEALKIRDKRLLKKYCTCFAFCFILVIFFIPVIGVSMVVSGCDAQERSIERTFDSLNVDSILIVKDRGEVEIEVLQPPSLPRDLNGTGNYYSLSNTKSAKIEIKVMHYARTPEALAEIFTVIQQVKGRITIYNWWDEAFNSAFDCPRSTVKLQLPHQIRDGIGKDIFEWDRELGEYVWAGTEKRIVETDLTVTINANQPSGWMMPLDSDIAMTGQTDVGLGKVNLTTNGGKVLVEKVSARELHVNVAAGGTNLTMVSSSNLHVNAKAATVWKHSSNYAVW
jgi:hypothetical protein